MTVEKAMAVNGPTYLHVLAVCPPGWKAPADMGIRLGRLAVQSGVFPLYEIENGQYKMNMDFAQLKPVQEYLKPQGRFSHLQPAQIELIQERVDREYQALRKKAARA